MSKVDIISGFLGAGKTTLISKLLKDSLSKEKVCLVENEFGEIGIDGSFLQDTGIEIKEINSGCICCSLKGDFEEALKKVDETYHPDRIIIEPSGVGKLSDVMKAVETVEGITINSFSTVVDANKCKVYHKNFKEFFDDQIASASCVILSKTQNMDDAKLEEVISIIKELNPKARIITTAWDAITGDTILKAMENSVNLLEDVCPTCGHVHSHDDHEHHHDHDACDCDHHHEEHDHDACDCDHHHEEHDECDHDEHEHHHHDHEEGCSCGHDHHHHHHGDHDADEVFTSIGIETIKKFTQEELETILSKLDENILRAKGIVPSTDNTWLFFDYVPGEIDVRAGNPNYTGLITVIGSKVDENQIKEVFGVK